LNPFASRLPHSIVEATNWSRDVGPQRKTLIVLHAMECAEKGDSAEAVGLYFQRQKSTDKIKSSCQFGVDCNSIVQYVPAERIAWHAPGVNTRAIGVEHAGWVRQTAAQWLDEYGKSMLALSARLVAELCEHFRIPCEFVDAEDIRAGLTGITTHAQVTLAFPEKGSHTDPGAGFPLRWYMDQVRKHTTNGEWAEV
jgi:N-acetyl-anhydromuramyl-L-alanine amidase AmpD